MKELLRKIGRGLVIIGLIAFMVWLMYWVRDQKIKELQETSQQNQSAAPAIIEVI